LFDLSNQVSGNSLNATTLLTALQSLAVDISFEDVPVSDTTTATATPQDIGSGVTVSAEADEAILALSFFNFRHTENNGLIDHRLVIDGDAGPLVRDAVDVASTGHRVTISAFHMAKNLTGNIIIQPQYRVASSSGTAGVEGGRIYIAKLKSR